MKTIIEAVADLVAVAERETTDSDGRILVPIDPEAVRVVLDAFLSKEGCESLKNEIAAFLGQRTPTPGPTADEFPILFSERREIGRKAVTWVEANGLPVTAMTIVHALAELHFLKHP